MKYLHIYLNLNDHALALKPHFILPNKAATSDGEDMAYNLQAFKRARTIISLDKVTCNRGLI